jgi:hypothetical protein
VGDLLTDPARALQDLQVLHPAQATDRAPLPRRGGRPTVTALTAVDEATARHFWRLYLEAFGPLRTRAAARQVLHEDEFLEEMVDDRVWKYIAWDDKGTAIGMTTLTRHLETVPWISPEFYQARYPEHFARQAVYYLGFTLVGKGARGVLSFAAMIEAVVERLAADRAVCGYDICAFNNESIRFADNIEAMLRRGGEAVTMDRLDSQTYYVADLSRHLATSQTTVLDLTAR